MDLIFSKRALEQMIRRNINYEIVLSTVSMPNQTIVDDKDPAIVVCQSLIKERESGQVFLLRVFVNRDKQPNVVVTLCKTTQISKYYENKIQ